MTAAPYSATMATVRKFNTEGPVRKGLERTVAEGVEQTCGYMDRCGAEAGHLVVSDRAPKRPWADKIFRRPPSPAVASRRAGHGLGAVAASATCALVASCT